MKQLLSFVLIIILLVTCGCGQQANERGQRLLISAVTDTECFITIPKEDLNGNYTGNISFQNVRDVTITLDGKAYPLEAAIADGLISVEEIESKNVTITPTVFSSIETLSIKSDSGISIKGAKMIDMLGRNVNVSINIRDEFSCEMSLNQNCNSGIYLIIVETEKGVCYEKVVLRD
jgi:hypothetical protein